MFEVEIAAMRGWLSANGLTRKEPAVRMFLDLLERNLQEQEFAIRPPGRLRYFAAVVREARAASVVQSWKLTALNYAASPLALLFGYRKAAEMYEARGRMTTKVERMLRGGRQKMAER
jgi:hypothetical protein